MQNILDDSVVSDRNPTAGDIIFTLVEMFSVPEALAQFRTPALELDTILMLDPNAMKDLVQALFGDQQPDLATKAGKNRLMDTLMAVGAIKQCCEPGNARNPWLTFHAGTLLDLLKRMPHRDPGLGVSRDQITDCTTKN